MIIINVFDRIEFSKWVNVLPLNKSIVGNFFLFGSTTKLIEKFLSKASVHRIKFKLLIYRM